MWEYSGAMTRRARLWFERGREGRAGMKGDTGFARFMREGAEREHVWREKI